MFENVYIFVERKCYPVSDYSYFFDLDGIDRKFIKTDGKNFEFIVTGFMICNDNPIVIFPKNYCITDDTNQLKSDVKLLLRVIMKYRMENCHTQEEIKLLFGDNKYSTEKIVSAISIIEDYLTNGYVERKMKKSSVNENGYTDWNKTVNQTISMISHGRPVYLSPIRRNNVRNVDSALTRIHMWTVSECLRMWGWLYDLDGYVECISSPYDVDTMLDILRQEESGIFIEREIYLIKNLIRYLNACKGCSDQMTYDLMVTPHFNLIWESICGFIYTNEYCKLSKWIAQPVWDGPVISKKISQRPDILFIDQDTFYILDAKYYDYNNTIPGWHDVVKQLFYKYTIEQKIKNRGAGGIKKFENVLIFPENSVKDFTYLGKVYVDGVTDLGEVKAFAVNTKRAMLAYISGTRDNFREELLIHIEKVNSLPDAATKRLMAYEKAMRGL